MYEALLKADIEWSEHFFYIKIFLMIFLMVVCIYLWVKGRKEYRKSGMDKMSPEQQKIFWEKKLKEKNNNFDLIAGLLGGGMLIYFALMR